ncbi:Hypothetical protein SRAE_2000475500 [Strongyloides ratti]|uniref:Uncharacterized protein n=1 Tax=Strongyloides ratti TaxID=34506 RepID=A0A090LK78_STRRB|nr:Hypothetical protein SRAE_2000475500 [Strongyloides ratti]CEF70118.1 Hypothetical protein SRAE_2000475500 [Strongyloides ratti]
MIQRKNIYFDHLKRNVGLNELHNFSNETVDMMLEREVVECFRKISNEKIYPGEDDSVNSKNDRRKKRENFNMCKSLGILRTLKKCENEAKLLLEESGVYIFESLSKEELAEFLIAKLERERLGKDKGLPTKICHLLSCAKSSVMFDPSVKNINDVPCTCGREINKSEREDMEKGFSIETFNHFNRIKKMKSKIPRVTSPSTEAYMVITPKSNSCKVVTVNPETNELEEISKEGSKMEIVKNSSNLKVDVIPKSENKPELPIEYIVEDKIVTHFKSSSKKNKHNENAVFEEGTDAFSYYENETNQVPNPFLEEMGLSPEEIEELKQDRTVVKKIEGLNPGELRIRIINLPERRPSTTEKETKNIKEEEDNSEFPPMWFSTEDSSSQQNGNWLGNNSFLEDPSEIDEDSMKNDDIYNSEEEDENYEFRKRKHSPPLTAVGNDANNKKRMFTYYQSQGSISSSSKF